MAKRALVNHYATLGVGPDADEVDIKKAYRVLVLQWHPDKHRENREAAEERIRNINAAYETLSNPARRQAYDLQRGAVEGGRGPAPPKKQRVNPKIGIPKEFMMQPLGHPDKFLRCVGKQAAVEARRDSADDFDTFFTSTKLSLWWLPEINNLCRIRALGSRGKSDRRNVAANIAGGLNLAFSFQDEEDVEAPVTLKEALKGKRSDSVNFIATPSPVYSGIYRFEAASKRNCYLVYTPPKRVGVVSLDRDKEQNGVIDFALVDFSAMANFIDIEEVLVPAVASYVGPWVSLEKLQNHPKVKLYFDKVLKKPMWESEDFVSYFSGHYSLWEMRPEDQCVRLRPPSEKLGRELAEAADAQNAAAAIANARAMDGGLLASLDFKAAAKAVELLATSRQEHDEEAVAELRSSAASSLLRALPSIATRAATSEEEKPSASQVLVLMEQASSLGKAEASMCAAAAARRGLAELLVAGPEELNVDRLSRMSCETLMAVVVEGAKTAPKKLPALLRRVAPQLAQWSPSDVLQLLLAGAKAQDDLPDDVTKAILVEASATIVPQLAALESPELVKLVLVASSAASSAAPAGSRLGVELLEAAAKEVGRRLSDLQQNQLLLVTQALAQGLGGGHASVRQLLCYWTELLTEATQPAAVAPIIRKKPAAATAGNSSAAGLKAAAGTPARSGELSADQLVRLAPAAMLAFEGERQPADADAARFFRVLGERLLLCLHQLTDAGLDLLREQLAAPGGGGFRHFTDRGRLVKALQRAEAVGGKRPQLEAAVQPAATAAPKKKKRRKK